APMRASAAVLGTLMLLTACGNDPAEPEASPVAGMWAWVESSGGIQGQTLTPDSEGYEVTLILTGDGTAVALRQRERVDEAQYTIRERLSLVTPVEYEITF